MLIVLSSISDVDGLIVSCLMSGSLAVSNHFHSKSILMSLSIPLLFSYALRQSVTIKIVPLILFHCLIHLLSHTSKNFSHSECLIVAQSLTRCTTSSISQMFSVDYSRNFPTESELIILSIGVAVVFTICVLLIHRSLFRTRRDSLSIMPLCLLFSSFYASIILVNWTFMFKSIHFLMSFYWLTWILWILVCFRKMTTWPLEWNRKVFHFVATMMFLPGIFMTVRGEMFFVFTQPSKSTPYFNSIREM